MVLRMLKELKGMSIDALDGEVGKVRDTYFDDRDWTVRYMVVDTGGWLSGRQVLITPFSVHHPYWDEHWIEVCLTREQVRNSPDIDTAKPVSRQHETDFYNHYGYPYYWAGPHLWGPVAFPRGTGTASLSDAVRRAQREHESHDPHLRSTNVVTGYHIEATDGSIGHIDDFLYDEDSWSLRYVVIDTRNWLPGKHVLVPVEWVEDVSWAERSIRVGLSREAIRASPEFDRNASLAPDLEAQLYKHYGPTIGDSGSRKMRI